MSSQDIPQTLAEAKVKIAELESLINSMDELVRNHFGDILIDGVCYEYVSGAVMEEF